MAAFDWSSLIKPALDLGMKAVGDRVAPGADLQSVQNSQQQNQFNNQMAMQKMGRSDQIRKMMMPGMFTTLGFSPDQGKQMASQYGSNMPAMQQGGSMPGYPQQKAPGLGSKIGSAALDIGASVAPGIIGGLLGGGGGGASAGGMAGLLGGLGATGVGAIAAGAIGAGLLAKKLIGRGRKQANKLTGPGGLQSNFNEGLTEIVAAQQSGSISQQERDNLVRQMYQQLQQDGAQFAAGGEKQALVVRQMLQHYLTNPVTASSLR